MFKLFGVKIKSDVPVRKGLLLVYGLGKPTVDKICFTIGINPRAKVSKLSRRTQGKIQHFLNVNRIQPARIKKLRRDSVIDLINKKSYRGMRHKINILFEDKEQVLMLGHKGVLVTSMQKSNIVI